MSSDSEVLPLVNQPVIAEPPKVQTAVVEYPTFRQVLAHASNICVDYAHAGVKEVGHNNGEQVNHFQQIAHIPPGSSWCAACVAMCEIKSFAQLMGQQQDMRSLLSFVGHFGLLYMPVSGLVETLWHEADARGWFHRRNKKGKSKQYRPRPGALVLYDFHQEGIPHHVGFFLQIDPEGTIKDVSGNTGPGAGGDQADGDGVYVRHRSTDRIFGFIDP